MKNKNYICAFDGLKGIGACVIAFTYHYFCSFGARPLNKYLYLGYMFGMYYVEIFFCISGFVTFMHYSNTTITFNSFLKKKIQRLYPLFLITTIITALLIYISRYITCNYDFSGGGVRDNLFHLFLNIIMLGAGWMEDVQAFNTPGWYVSILMICYIIFFLIQKCKMNEKVYVYIIWCIIGLWIVHQNPFPQFPLVKMENGRGYLSFSIGCILAHLYLNGFLEKNKRLIIKLIFVLLTLIFCLVYVFSKDIIGDMYVFVGCIVSPSIILISLLCNKARILLESNILKKLGQLSYAIYLWHCPFYVGINLINYICSGKIDFCNNLTYVFICIITIITAAILNYLVKKSCQAISNRMSVNTDKNYVLKADKKS